MNRTFVWLSVCLALGRFEKSLVLIRRSSALVHVAQLIASCRYLFGNLVFFSRNGIYKGT